MMKTWHKWVLAIIVIVGIIVCIKSCMDRKTPDLTIAYIGEGFVDREAFDENKGLITPLCEDIDSDGEINIDVMEISFNEELTHADKSNAQSKMTNAIGAGAARLYFIEESYMMQNASTGFFADISSLGGGYKNTDGQVVAISVKGNKKLDRMGIDTESDIYLAIRVVSEVDTITDKKIAEKDKSAWNVAEYILND